MRIVVIAGPPCAGKTTFADLVAGPEDVVLDFDVVARELGSPVLWSHPEPWRSRAEADMQAAVRWAVLEPSEATAWVIRTAPRPRQRAELAERWNARVYLLNPGERECRRRARADGRPAGTSTSIGEWFSRYAPWIYDQNPGRLRPEWASPSPPVDRGIVCVDPRYV
jgi:hypothetical protein